MSTSSFIFLSEFPHPMWSLLTPCMSYNVWGLDELRPIFPQPSNGPGSIFCHSLSDLISRASVEMNLLCTAASLCTTALFPFNSAAVAHFSEIRDRDRDKNLKCSLFNFLFFFSRFSSFFLQRIFRKEFEKLPLEHPFHAPAPLWFNQSRWNWENPKFQNLPTETQFHQIPIFCHFFHQTNENFTKSL